MTNFIVKLRLNVVSVIKSNVNICLSLFANSRNHNHVTLHHLNIMQASQVQSGSNPFYLILTQYESHIVRTMSRT